MVPSNKIPKVIPVDSLTLVPGRHGFHFEPDFCGQMNVVLDERSPDRVVFLCETNLIEGNVLMISDGDLQTLRVRITRSVGNRYAATVIDQD